MPWTPDFRHAPLIAALALGLVVTGALGAQAYSLYQQAQAPAEAPRGNAEQGLERPPALDQPLEQLTFFGQAEDDDEAEDMVNIEELPETNLQLTLRGVMAGSGETRHNAVIQDSDGETDVYFLGDTLPGDARLRSVHTRRIVIERNGSLETLHFPDEEQLAMTRQSRPQPQPEQRSERDSRRRDSGGDDSRQREVRERLEALRERLRN